MKTTANHDHRPVAPIDLEAALASAFDPDPAAPMVALPGGAAVPYEAVFNALATLVARELHSGAAEAIAADDVDPGAVGGLTRNFTAGNDIPAHRAVLVNPELGCALLGIAGPELTLGVAPDGAGRDQPVCVTLSGVEMVETAGPVQRARYVEVTAEGRIIEAWPKPGYQIACLGLALGAATAAGERVPVLISPAKLYA